MPSFSIVKEHTPKESFRVAYVRGAFDLPEKKISEKFSGEIDIGRDWQIGLIVGGSGTGKSTIAKELFPESIFYGGNFTSDAVINDMPSNASAKEVCQAFNSVGFSSPPSWLKPYNVLSNGEKMRVDLAYCLLANDSLFVFDEFTSVVDRQVAKIGSYAIQKAIRKGDKKFIAVTCHEDVTDWLLPDWIFNTNTMTFTKSEGQKKNRPFIHLTICKEENAILWKDFAKYHYLSHTHNKAAKVFTAYINNVLVGFLSVQHFPHSRVKNIKKVHRLVILPEYQGASIGRIFLEKVGDFYKTNGFKYFISTSNPALVYGLAKSKNWRTIFVGASKPSKTTRKDWAKEMNSNRKMGSFEYLGQ